MFGNIVVFEDHEESNFYPLTELRPVFELKTGIFSMMERIYMKFPDSRYHLFARDYLRPSMLLKYPQFFINDQNVGVQALLLNGRLVMTKSFAELLNSQRKRNFLVVDGHNILAAHLEKKLLQQFINIGTLERFKPDILLEYVRKNNEIRVISYKEDILLKNPWDLINKNGDCLKKDFKLLNKGGLILSDINTQVILTKEDNIFIDKHSKIYPFVHLDASKGPIYIA